MNLQNPEKKTRWPYWLRQVEQYLDICSHFIISGNIRDLHLIPTTEGDLFCSTVESIEEVLRPRGLEVMMIYDQVDGLRTHQEDGFTRVADALGREHLTQQSPGPMAMGDLARLMSGLQVCSELRVCLIVDYASRLISRATDLSDIESEFFTSCVKLADTSQEIRASRGNRDLLFNPVFWLVNSPNDLPDWFVVGNERVKGMPIELPSREVRTQASTRLVRDLPGAREIPDTELLKISERLVDLTDGISLTGMLQIRTIARQSGTPAEKVEDAVRSFKVGVSDNPWKQSHLQKRLLNGETLIGETIKGQGIAVKKTLDILKRSVLGLSGAQASSSVGRPRGILFFAGPTGVGKTELAKAITKLIFGDEQAYTRFDMSEFSSEHSEARLIGAPPGYIGFDGGGELVNAVRQKPFSLILFDEIEKAHPRILDKFLQVLEDGRLTDGRGRTVFFSETVLVFTSNLGMCTRAPRKITGCDLGSAIPGRQGGESHGPAAQDSEFFVAPTRDERGARVQNVSIECSYQQIDKRIRSEISEHFRFELQRPELLNRFGDNIVVFDFIREKVADEIFHKMLSNIVSRVHRELGIDISISEDVIQIVRNYCTSDLTNGGRGIGNKLETILINPLSRELFRRDLRRVSLISIIGMEISDSSVMLYLE